ncbi:hypothetical protein KUC_0017 [Vreelandella boliviensis LC1]|uniref:Uncharacterized protein n=1 Tax=Vreelandella boliviensis LC1 TaxID=1072583 RepID=A0A7U9GG99_9GAMM|nr:hypothetical protein KUC_0017 [Halomonas boliviensis LC1]
MSVSIKMNVAYILAVRVCHRLHHFLWQPCAVLAYIRKAV